MLIHHNVYGKYLILYINYTSTKAQLKKNAHELSEEKSFPHFSSKIEKSFKTLKENWSCLVYWQQKCLQNSFCATACCGDQKRSQLSKNKKNKWSQTGPWDLKKCCQSLRNENHKATVFGSHQSSYGHLCSWLHLGMTSGVISPRLTQPSEDTLPEEGSETTGPGISGLWGWQGTRCAFKGGDRLLGGGGEGWIQMYFSEFLKLRYNWPIT